MAIRALSFLLLACVGAVPASARALDQSRVHGYYHDGEFDKVIKELEAYQKAGPCARAESLFIEKHLAVVYAANPTTRELGRYHMYRMLDLQPEVDLLDMFVGEEVDGVFDKVRKEHVLRSGTKAPAVASAPAAKATAAPLSIKPAAAPQLPKPVVATPQPNRPPVAATPAPRPPLAIASRPAPQPRPAQYPSARPRLRPATPATAAAAVKAVPGAPEKPVAEAAVKPAWKEPGLWVGGGAALAVVAITLFYSGDKAQPTPSKVYVVPATASK